MKLAVQSVAQSVAQLGQIRLPHAIELVNRHLRQLRSWIYDSQGHLIREEEYRGLRLCSVGTAAPGKISPPSATELGVDSRDCVRSDPSPTKAT